MNRCTLALTSAAKRPFYGAKAKRLPCSAASALLQASRATAPSKFTANFTSLAPRNGLRKTSATPAPTRVGLENSSGDSTFILHFARRSYARSNWYQNSRVSSRTDTALRKARAFVLERSPWSGRNGGRWSSYSSESSGDADRTVYILIAANTAVFLTWQYAKELYRQQGDWKLWKFMQQNFTSGYVNSFLEKRFYTLWTSTFSHNTWGHFLMNMVVLYSFGPVVAATVGTGRFLALYTAAGTIGSSVSLMFNRWRSPHTNVRGLGASGSLMGVTALYACMFPTIPVQIFFFIPVPAALAVGGFAAYDIYRTLLPNGLVDSVAHLSGGLVGVMYYFSKIRRVGRF